MTKTTQNTSESPPQLTRKVDVKAIRDASPQARHHFTVADQVEQLVGASGADPDLGFMARLMALCSLHHHLAFRVLVEAALPHLADVVTGPPVLSGRAL